MTLKVWPALRWALLVGVVALTGCAAPARVEQMQVNPSLTVRTIAATSPLRDHVAIKDVTGGKETNPMWISNVSSSDFERSLEASLKNVGLLAVNRQGSKYTLTAHLLKLDQPLLGVSMTVTAAVQYSLIERSTGKEIWADTLVTPYTAAWDAAFLGSERLKLANEGAARTNIEKLIDALVALKIEGVAAAKP
jgi:hypothetical protein